MPVEHSGESEAAHVTVTPAVPPAPDAVTDPPATPPATDPTTAQEAPVSTKPNLLQRLATALLPSLLVLALALAVGCVPNQPAPTNPSDEAGLSDSGSVQTFAGIPTFRVDDTSHAPAVWHAHFRVDKCYGEVAVCTTPYEVVEGDHNLLTTAGATALWNGLSTSGLATPFSTTNAMLAVGDGSTAPAVGNTDLAAALGTKVNSADFSSCTNATPIVCSGTSLTVVNVGSVLACSGFSGAGAAAINQTFEVSASSSSSVTLLNSAASGAITVTGGVCQPVNKYRQQANASGSAVVSGNQITYVATFGTSNANFAWNEWSVTTGAAATNKQAAPPPTMLDRATPGGGLGSKTSSASWTLTVVLSLS